MECEKRKWGTGSPVKAVKDTTHFFKYHHSIQQIKIRVANKGYTYPNPGLTVSRLTPCPLFKRSCSAKHDHIRPPHPSTLLYLCQVNKFRLQHWGDQDWLRPGLFKLQFQLPNPLVLLPRRSVFAHLRL